MTTTTHDELTVVKLLAANHSISFTATATHLTEDMVRKVGGRYGYPDTTKLEWAVDELTQAIDLQARAGIPQAEHANVRVRPSAAKPRLDRDEQVPTVNAKPASVAELRPATAPTEVETPVVVDELPIPTLYLLARAANSEKARTRQLGERIAGELDSLRQRLDEEDADRRYRQQQEAERKAVLDEIAAAEEALRIAREKARRFKNHPGGNRPAAVARSATPDAQAARRKAGKATNRVVDYNPREVRAWAKANGIACPSNGRFLPKDVVDAWRTRAEAS